MEQKKINEEDMRKKQYTIMTTKPIGQLLFSLSIPTIISMMVTNIYNIVDTAFVGTLGTSESGATGIVFGYMAILQAIAFMCGQGAGSLMSRKLGEKNIDHATKYTSTGFFLSFFMGMIIAIASYFFMDPLLYILGSTKTIAVHARVYIFYILISAPFFTSSLTMNNLLRYEGKAKFGTVGLMIGAVLNISGDAILMFGMKMGIAGAGISTAISQFISFLILLSMFISGKTQTKINIKYISKDIKTIFNIVGIGFPSLLRQGLNSVATILLNKYAGMYGDHAVSAMSAVSRISFFPIAVAIGIGQGFQPISSFNYGANKKERVRKAFWYSLLGEEIALFIISIPIFIYAAPLVKRLRDDSDVIKIGVRALRLMCIGELFVPLTMMVEMGFQSIGKKIYASFASSLRSGLIFVPTLIVMANIRKMSGIEEAQPLSFILSFAIGLFFCKIYLEKLKE